MRLARGLLPLVLSCATTHPGQGSADGLAAAGDRKVVLDAVAHFKVPREFAPERRRAAAPAGDEWVSVQRRDGSGGRLLAGSVEPALPDSVHDVLAARPGGGSLQVMFVVLVDAEGAARLEEWLTPSHAQQVFRDYYAQQVAAWRFEPYVIAGRPTPRVFRHFIYYPKIGSR